MSGAGDRGRVGGRRSTAFGREVALFMTVALGVLVVVSTFTLVGYWSAVAEQTEVERDRALRLATRVATELLGRTSPGPADLARVAPGAEWVGLLGDRGGTLAESGVPPPGAPFDVTGGVAPAEATAAGPGPDTGGRVVAVTPLPDETGRYVRVDLTAGPLAARRDSLRILAAVVVGADVAVTILVLLFVRRLLRPWGRLVERARQVGPAPEGGEEEIEFLLATFDRAMGELARQGATSPLEALRGALGGEGGESGVVVLDAEHRIVAASPVAAELIGAELPVGTAIQRALAGSPRIGERIGALLEAAEPKPLEELELGPEAEHRRLGVSVFPVGGGEGDGERRGALLLLADLTEARRRASAERLAESLADLGELAAGVAHELRNGIATISGHLELMERHAGEPPSPRHLAALRRECRELERVVSDFLAFARPGSARLERVDLAALLEELAAPSPAGSAVALEIEADSPAWCRADPLLLRRALTNLLENARRAQDEAGSDAPVRLSLQRAGEEWRIAVEDRGPGVPEEVRDRLFRPFVSGRPEGTGLGLPLAWRILRLHGGRLELEPAAAGGTVAEVRLPVWQDREES